jgi:hypothetical protein
MKGIRTALSGSIKRSPIVVGAIAICVAIVTSGTGVVLGRYYGQTFSGTIAPGAHEWTIIVEGDMAASCVKCHPDLESIHEGAIPLPLPEPPPCNTCHVARNGAHVTAMFQHDPALPCDTCHEIHIP